jgi:hypothetical protein
MAFKYVWLTDGINGDKKEGNKTQTLLSIAYPLEDSEKNKWLSLSEVISDSFKGSKG